MTSQQSSTDEQTKGTDNIQTTTPSPIKQSVLMKLSGHGRLASHSNKMNVQFANAPPPDPAQPVTKFPNVPRAMSQPAVYTENLSNSLPEGQNDSTDEIIDQEKLSELANPVAIPINVTNKKPPFYNSDDQSLNRRQAVQKKYSSLSMSVSMTNKMPVTRTREMAIGGRRINNRHTAKININGKKVHVGIGFPTNIPIIGTESAKLIKDSDKSYENLESIIQKLKSDNSTAVSTLENRVKERNDGKANSENSNEANKQELLTNNDITRLSTEIGSTKAKFAEMEKSILDDVTTIRTSIDKLMQDRKDLQQKHKIWLEDRKKKIFQAKGESRKIGNAPYVGPAYKQQQFYPQIQKA